MGTSGGKENFQAGKPKTKYGTVKLCLSGRILLLVCAEQVGEVRGKRGKKKDKPSAVGVMGCAASLVALWQSSGFVLLPRDRGTMVL